jgi:5-methylcytosine-specific restriction endonuclease McrA
MRVFVVDKDRNPLDPCHPARAREMLRKGRAAVLRRFPFTIILKDREAASSAVHDHRVKIDPGSKATGIAVIAEQTGRVVFAAEIEHRGHRIKASMESRASLRSSRRNRKTRHRKPRHDNRSRRDGWLPPSMESRLSNILTWAEKIRRFCPISAISQELVRFDTQKIENPEISGVEYSRGTLFGSDVREYLLEKWDRKCAYCGKEGVPLQVEHIHPKSKGGSDRVSNLTLACEPCNQKKGSRPIEDFLKGKPDLLAKIKSQAKAPLKDAAAVNVTRWVLWQRLKATGLPVECGTGGRTKFNRTQRGLPKFHWLDAACVGVSTPATLIMHSIRPLVAKAMGHGSRQMCGTDKYGFPIRHKPRASGFAGFKTGDIVRAVIPNGKYKGKYVGRIAIRHRPSFLLGKINVHPDRLSTIHRSDGYSYSTSEPWRVEFAVEGPRRHDRDPASKVRSPADRRGAARAGGPDRGRGRGAESRSAASVDGHQPLASRQSNT